MPPHVHFPLLGGCPRAGCGTRSRRYNEHGEISRGASDAPRVATGGGGDAVVQGRAVAHARSAGVRGALDLDMVRVLELAVLRRGNAARRLQRPGRPARARAAVGGLAAGERRDHRVFAHAVVLPQPAGRRALAAPCGRRAHRGGDARALSPGARRRRRGRRAGLSCRRAGHRRGQRHRRGTVGRAVRLTRIEAHRELLRGRPAHRRRRVLRHPAAARRRGPAGRGPAAGGEHGLLPALQAQRAPPAPARAQRAGEGAPAAAARDRGAFLRRVVRRDERPHGARGERLAGRARPAEHRGHRRRNPWPSSQP